MGKLKEILPGETFGSWTAEGRAPNSKGGSVCWNMACACGRMRQAVRGSDLRSGASTKCRRCCDDELRKRMTTHGHCRRGRRSPEHMAWIAARRRCENQNDRFWPDYGGRGIQMCPRWRKNFANFLADMGEKPPDKDCLDRYPNPDGNYEPGNCRWATWKESNGNKHNIVWIEFDGRRMIQSNWAREARMTSATFGYRRRAGWSIKRIMSTPIDASKKHPRHLVRSA